MRNVNLGNIRLLSRSKVWEFLIALLIFYIFCFQYSIKVINGTIAILCFLIISVGLTFIFSKGKVHSAGSFWGFILFVIVSFVFSILFSVSIQRSIVIGVRMIEYCLTAFSIYFFMIKYPHSLLRVFSYIHLSIFLLAITVLYKGVEVTSSGAVGINELNVNEMSSFFLLMCFCSFYLLLKFKKGSQKLYLSISIIVTYIAQIQTASRRGFIVLSVLIVLCLFYAIVPSKYRGSQKRILILSLTGITLVILVIFIRDKVIIGSVLEERLLGHMVSGDLARARYQSFAIERFLSQPIIGIGLGGISYYLGVYSHSLYFETLACTGLTGSIILLFALLKIGVKLFKNGFLIVKSNRYKSRPELKISFIYWLGLVISGVVVVMIYDFNFYLSLALLAAIIENHNSEINIQSRKLKL